MADGLTFQPAAIYVSDAGQNGDGQNKTVQDTLLTQRLCLCYILYFGLSYGATYL